MELGDGSVGDKHNSGGDGRREQFNATAKVEENTCMHEE